MATTEQFGDGNSKATATIQSMPEITKAKDICNMASPPCKKTSVYQAIALMVKKNLPACLLSMNQVFVGLISEKDVLKLLYETEFVAGCVGDYMTTEVFTFDEEDDLVNVCQCLMKIIFEESPSCTRETRRNRKQGRPYQGQQRQVPTRCRQDDRNVPTDFVVAKDVMKSGLLTVRTSTPIYKAMEIIATENITGLPVVDDYMNTHSASYPKKTLSSFFMTQTQRRDSWQDCMTREVVSFDRNTRSSKSADCLINNNFRRIPILENGNLAGIISRPDIMTYIMKNR